MFALKSEVFELPVSIDPTHLNDEELGEVLKKIDAVLLAKKAYEQEALRRARAGDKIPGRKLVKKKTTRTFKTSMTVKEGDDELKLEDAAVIEFGMDAYEEPKLKSPAQMEKLKGGRDFVSKWAYSPDNGLTLAPDSDTRPEVKPTIERARSAQTT